MDDSDEDLSKTVPVGYDPDRTPSSSPDREGSPLLVISNVEGREMKSSPAATVRGPLTRKGSGCPVAPKKPHPPSPPPRTLCQSPLAKIAMNQLGDFDDDDDLLPKDLIFGGATPSMSLLAQKVRDQLVSKVIVVLGPYAAVGPQHIQRYTPSGNSDSNGQPLLSVELLQTTVPSIRDSLNQLGYCNLQEAHDEKHYRTDPSFLCGVWRDLWPCSSKPLLSHVLCKVLHEKGILLRVYSYNLEGLERSIGTPRSKVIELNGTFSAAHCIECGREHMSTYLKEKLNKNQRPTCTFKSCKGLVRPSITMKGQKKDPPHSTIIEADMNECDLVISVGAPPDGISGMVDTLAPRLILDTLQASFTDGGTTPDEYRDVVRHSIDDGLIEFIKECDYEYPIKNLLPPPIARHLQPKLAAMESNSVTRSRPLLSGDGGILKETARTTSLACFPQQNRKNHAQVNKRRAGAPPMRAFSQVVDFNKTICRSGVRSASAGPNIPATGSRTPLVKPLSAPSAQFVKEKTVQFDPCVKIISDDLTELSEAIKSGNFLRTPITSPLGGSFVSSPSQVSQSPKSGCGMSPFALVPLAPVEGLSPLMSPLSMPSSGDQLPISSPSDFSLDTDAHQPLNRVLPPTKPRAHPTVKQLSDACLVRSLSDTINLSPPKGAYVKKGTPKIAPLSKPFR